MRYFLRYIFASLTIALLVACGQAPTGGASQPTAPIAPTQAPEATAAPAQPTSLPAPTAPSKGNTGAPQPAGAKDIVVIYQRSGGIAGIDETLTVYADGKLQLSSRGKAKEAQVAPADLSKLQELLASPEFAALEPRYPASGADLITYTVTVPAAGKGHTVVTMDAAKNPPVLNEVLTELGNLLQQVK
jgi:hypothetical protein